MQELIISTVTDIEQPLVHVPQREFLSSPFGNPFSERTTFYLSTAGATSITLEVLDMLGKSLLRRRILTEAGVHQFRFDGRGLDPGLYFLVATVGSKQLVTKMLKTDNGGTAKPEFVYEGLVSRELAVSDGFRKAKTIRDEYRFIGYAKGFVPDTISASVERDTTYVFRLRPVNTAPDITTFAADTYDAVNGESVRYTIIVKDAEVNLSTVWIDFERDGVYDDSSSISGGDARTYFQKAFPTAGTYQAMARAMDRAGLMCERSLPTPVRVTNENAAPSISAFVASSYGVMTGDSVTYTVTLTDPDGDLSKVWMDYDGDGVYDDSGSVSGGSAIVHFSTTFKTPGSYLTGARASDRQGQHCEKRMSNPVIVTATNTSPSIISFAADSYDKFAGDTVRYTVSANDAEGSLSKVWIDYNGDSVFDDSISISGSDALVSFTTVLLAPGSYSSKAKASDSKGLQCEKSLPGPVIVRPILPRIARIDPADILSGVEVRLSGEHFGVLHGNSTVFFAGGDSVAGTLYLLAAVEYASWSDTAILLRAPAGIKVDGVVYVQVDGGTSNRVPFSLRAAFTVSGILAGNGMDVSGIRVSDGTRIAVTDQSGGYMITNVPNGSYTILPVTPGMNCSPVMRSVTVNNSDVHDVDFVLRKWASISGTITGEDVDLSGITVSDGTRSAVTDISGAYRIPDVPNGFYTITPTKIGLTFTPVVKAVTVSDVDVSQVDFVASGPGAGTVIDIDGNVYHTVTIGTQVWMVENLKTTRCNDGNIIPMRSDSAAWMNSTSAAYCWYNNNPTNKDVYGALYNWHAVATGTLAPAGWHVPTDADWTTLTDYLGGLIVAGGAMKETGTVHWSSPNTGADNSSGFTALPGGNRTGGAFFSGMKAYGNYWSSTANGSTLAWHRYLASWKADVSRNTHYKTSGLSVRCVKD
ncbi:MAG: T9SS type A sorting domain-containing protein [Ignavibacteria bacterium]|nr:T9SS type A sorting domain-containing protein [Ignavibacteria bacterium]